MGHEEEDPSHAPSRGAGRNHAACGDVVGALPAGKLPCDRVCRHSARPVVSSADVGTELTADAGSAVVAESRSARRGCVASTDWTLTFRTLARATPPNPSVARTRAPGCRVRLERPVLLATRRPSTSTVQEAPATATLTV